MIGTTTTNLLYDATDLIAEYDAAGTTLQRRYVHGPGTDEPIVWYEGSGTTAKNWFYADHLGSIVATANATGTSTGIYSYGPYGEPNTTTGPRFRYTGQQFIGDLGVYHYKARFYSPSLGRFLQTDPIGYKDDVNLYAYVGNNPSNRTDPSGLKASEAAALAAGVGGASSGSGPADYVIGSGSDPNMIRTNAAVVAAPVIGGLLVCQAMPSCRDGLATGAAALGNWVFNDGANSADRPTTTGDVLAPNGQPAGERARGAGPGVRTVTPGQLDGIIDGLNGLGAKPGSNGNYPGDWYDLPNNQGGFGIRDSRGSGRTVDVNIPGVPDVTKIHQRP